MTESEQTFSTSPGLRWWLRRASASRAALLVWPVSTSQFFILNLESVRSVAQIRGYVYGKSLVLHTPKEQVGSERFLPSVILVFPSLLT